MGKSKDKGNRVKKVKRRRQWKRIKTKKTKRWMDRKNWMDHHHLIPRSRNGETTPDNLLKIKRFRHEAWHILFDLPDHKCRTLDEIITLLMRMSRAKKRQKKQ
ncbi:MAG: hypothetical protein WCV80_03540 [Candidatus Paceibacterota bacterium]|jgi:hypothetical protein